MVYQLDPDAPSTDSLAAYTEWLLLGGLAVSTVRNHMAAVRSLYLWVENFIAADLLISPTWSLTIRGLTNTVRPSYSDRAAFTPDDLLSLMEESARHDDLTVLNVALAFCFFAYLRISNLAPPKLQEFDPTRHTTFGDISIKDEGLLLSLKWSKTRQSRTHPVAIPLPSLGDSWLCPLKVWRIYNTILSLKQVTITPDTPLLLTTSGPAGRIITIPALRAMFNKALSLADLQGAGYTPHSLRRGGATFSYHAGVDLQQIKHHGTWKSQAVDNYLFGQGAFSTPVSESFQKLLTNYN